MEDEVCLAHIKRVISETKWPEAKKDRINWRNIERARNSSRTRRRLDPESAWPPASTS